MLHPLQPPGRRTPSPHVLVLDECQDNVTSTAFLLQLHGYRVSVAHDVSTALELARAFKPNLILTEFRIPRHYGIQILPVLRTLPELERTKIAVITGSIRIEDRYECQRFRALYIRKPLDPVRGLRHLDGWFQDR